MSEEEFAAPPDGDAQRRRAPARPTIDLAALARDAQARRDAETAAALAGGPAAPSVEVIDFYDRGNAERVAAVMEPLRSWVDWMITTWQLRTADVPPCWWRHSHLLQELYALWCMYQLAFNPTDSGQGPIAFAERFALARGRLRAATAQIECNPREHRDAPEVTLTDASGPSWWAAAGQGGA